MNTNLSRMKDAKSNNYHWLFYNESKPVLFMSDVRFKDLLKKQGFKLVECE